MTGSEILGWAIGIEMRVYKGLWAYGCLGSGADEGFEGHWDNYDPSFVGRWMALVASGCWMVYRVKGRCCAAQSTID